MNLENTIILLNGYPATGKLTIGREICRISNAVLVDNHLINNPIFTVIGADGKTALPPEAKTSTRSIRRTVYETMAKVSPPQMSFVLTGGLYNNYAPDITWYEETKAVATTRKATFIPLKLKCQPETLLKRVGNLDRRTNLKMVNPEALEKEMQSYTLMDIDHPNAWELDVTNLSVAEAANQILAHTQIINKAQAHA